MFRDGNGPGMMVAVLVAGAAAALLTRTGLSPPAADGGQGAPRGSLSPAAPPPGVGRAPGDPIDADHWMAADFGGAGSHVADVAVVTALLPDPATSGFAGEMDLAIEAIERAAESDGYVLGRHFLPWTRQGDAAVVRAGAAGRAGWLLFHRDDSDARVRLLLVLVVGERPGGGVDRAMLADALAAGRRAGARATRPELLVLGPYFSGSADSLREGLEAWCRDDVVHCAAHPVEILSGTATRRLNAMILGAPGLAPAATPPAGAPPPLPLRVRFRATVNADEALADGMTRFFETLSVDIGQRAELTETSSAFGNAYASAARAVRPGPGGALPPATVGPAATPARPTPPSPRERPIQIPFPAHLASLRDGSARGGLAPAASSIDTVPLVSTDAERQTDLTLRMTFWALRRQGVSDVGVLTSSARDKVFLVSALRDAVPDIRAYVYEASVVLADPLQRRAMDGTLVASSYPLSPTTQLWGSKDAGAQLFPSDGAQGVYNALVALLHPPAAPGGDGATLAATLKDYVFPFGSGGRLGPSVWISVIIGGQLWPLAVYRSAAKDPYVFGSNLEMPARREPPPAVERSAAVLVGLFALTLLVVANLLALSPRFLWLRRLSILLTYAPEGDPALRGVGTPAGPAAGPQAHSVMLVGIWVLSLMGAATAALYELPRLGFPEAPFRREEALAGVLFIASLALVAVALRHEVRRRRLYARGPLRLWLYIVLPSALAVWGLAGLVRFASTGDTPDGRALFFFTRLMHPGLGLTPTLPIAFVVAALYTACLFRLRVLRRSVRLLAAGLAWRSDALAGCGDEMIAFARSARRSLIHALVIGIAIGFVIYFWKPVRPRSLEGPMFDFLAALSFGITFTCAAASLFRAASLWGTLSQLLRRLAIHPLVWSYGHLPESFARGFRTPLPRRIRHVDVDAACQAALRLMDDNPLRPDATPAPAARAANTGQTIRAVIVEVAPEWAGAGREPVALQRAEPERALAVRVREHYLALRMGDTLACMCDVTRTMLFIGASSVVAAVLATAAYPFQPAGTLAWAATLAVAAVILIAVRLIVGIERDEVLSRLARTQPGQITPSWSLAVRLFGYVLVPLGSLLAAHLPGHAVLRELIESAGKALEH